MNLPTDQRKKWLYGLLVLSFAVYTGRVYRLPGPRESMDRQALEGKMIWQKKNCTACHQLYGLGGFLGPDLTNVMSSPGRSPEYIRAFVTGGTATMPSFQLSDDEFESLVAFLRHVDSSGKSDPRRFAINLDGTIQHK